jgi:hypothetical protein
LPTRPDLRLQLLALAERDLTTRERLAKDGSLFEGYHPEMQALHEENAAALDALVGRHGWPTTELVGADGAEAAWLIVQHAISLPEFCRRGLALLRAAAENGALPKWQPAYLEDRIRSLEGRPQLYGTSFDWDDEGLMSPLPIEDAANVDERRAAVGLGPVDEAVARHRRDSASEPRPRDLARRRAGMEAWASKVGWRRSV